MTDRLHSGRNNEAGMTGEIVGSSSFRESNRFRLEDNKVPIHKRQEEESISDIEQDNYEMGLQRRSPNSE